MFYDYTNVISRMEDSLEKTKTKLNAQFKLLDHCEKDSQRLPTRTKCNEIEKYIQIDKNRNR